MVLTEVQEEAGVEVVLEEAIKVHLLKCTETFTMCSNYRGPGILT